MASSRVGVTTSARGPGPFAEANRSISGRTKASVFPEPVGASITTSRPSSRGGSASVWTATGSWMPFFCKAPSKRVLTPSSAKVDITMRTPRSPLPFFNVVLAVWGTPLGDGEENPEPEGLALEVWHSVSTIGNVGITGSFSRGEGPGPASPGGRAAPPGRPAYGRRRRQPLSSEPRAPSRGLRRLFLR